MIFVFQKVSFLLMKDLDILILLTPLCILFVPIEQNPDTPLYLTRNVWIGLQRQAGKR